VATDAEKRRLNELFTHKGGKALPEELIHPVGACTINLSSEDVAWVISSRIRRNEDCHACTSLLLRALFSHRPDADGACGGEEAREGEDKEDGRGEWGRSSTPVWVRR
jgi:hypothetical protein